MSAISHRSEGSQNHADWSIDHFAQLRLRIRSNRNHSKTFVDFGAEKLVKMALFMEDLQNDLVCRICVDGARPGKRK